MLDREMGGMNRRWCRALFRSRKGAATASWLGRGPDRCRALRIQSTPQHVGKSANVASQSPPPVNEGLWPHRARYVARDVPEKLAGNLSNGHGSLAQHIDWVDDLRVTKPIACHPAALDTHVDSAGTRALDEPTSAFGKRRAEMAAVASATQRSVLADYSPGLLDRLITVCVSGTLISYSLYTISPQTIALHGSADLVYTVPIVTYALFRYLYLVDREHAAEDPARLMLTDHHLQAAALIWLGTVIWILR